VRLKLNGTHQLLAYADDMNPMLGNIDTVNKNTETFNNARKEVGLERNADKTNYVFLSHYQIAGKNRDIKIANRSLKLGGL
jgi:hypothetical protein